ncbi:hypothetical protein PF010_g2689 [Phytophthora fragariae]|uniref:Uncharacterized protein n=1 Tax=Phytophthora fragariae TaxID=53985 RepID=A0A6G0PQ16_9STRA|nr:hypothetical protein PF010_g2689 [Phytophthora fragariae]KAE9251822.1 hypothetical protein PF004_g2273 [Phytophthora fragariae]
MTCNFRSAGGLASRRGLCWQTALLHTTSAAVFEVIGAPGCMARCCSVSCGEEFGSWASPAS